METRLLRGRSWMQLLEDDGAGYRSRHGAHEEVGSLYRKRVSSLIFVPLFFSSPPSCFDRSDFSYSSPFHCLPSVSHPSPATSSCSDNGTLGHSTRQDSGDPVDLSLLSLID